MNCWRCGCALQHGACVECEAWDADHAEELRPTQAPGEADALAAAVEQRMRRDGESSVRLAELCRLIEEGES